MELRFTGEVWFWRGPAPFHFVTVPPAEAEVLREAAAAVSYGWGMVPAEVVVGRTAVRTALWPKDGGYVVPLKQALRDAERVDVGDRVEVVLRVDGTRPRVG